MATSWSHWGIPQSRDDIPLPLVPLSDCSGDVIEVGRAVDRFQVGDRVSSAQMPDWTAGPFKPENAHSALGGAVDGVLAKYFCGNQRGFVKIPDTLSFEEAATLPTAALTRGMPFSRSATSSPGRRCWCRVPAE